MKSFFFVSFTFLHSFQALAISAEVSALSHIIQGFWYYAMVQFRKFDLKLDPIAQFEENRIICKTITKFK